MIGERIKELRKSKGISQYKLAEDTGFAQQTISSWEAERNEPTIFSCIVLADFFGVTLDELCRGKVE